MENQDTEYGSNDEISNDEKSNDNVSNENDLVEVDDEETCLDEETKLGYTKN